MNQFPNKTKYVLISVALIATIGLGFILFKNRSGSENESAKNLANIPAEVAENVEKVSSKANIFTHPDLGFSFEYLSDYALTEIPDDAGETILMQKEGKGAQVYISDFTANVVFDSALVKQELAGEKMDNLKDITTSGGFPAVSFSSSDPSLGDTFEVWFVKSGKLYQITAQSGHEELLKIVVDSWKFN